MQKIKDIFIWIGQAIVIVFGASVFLAILYFGFVASDGAYDPDEPNIPAPYR